mmetsp:Transcript_21122/g.21238  ORF Transcript_21122/g.21238 Transcript_21122/m.21238 type:complete len:126 (-) Transcript_21122:7-384(-)
MGYKGTAILPTAVIMYINAHSSSSLSLSIFLPSPKMLSFCVYFSYLIKENLSHLYPSLSLSLSLTLCPLHLIEGIISTSISLSLSLSFKAADKGDTGTVLADTRLEGEPRLLSLSLSLLLYVRYI